MRKILLLFFVLLFLNVPALAWSDNLSTSWGGSYADGTITPTGWYVGGGTFDTDLGYMRNTNAGAAEIRYPISNSSTYFEFVIRYLDPGTQYVCWVASSVGAFTCTRGLEFTAGGINGMGFTYASAPPYTNAQWYKVTVSISGSQANITVYNMAGAVVDSDVVAYTSASTNYFAFYSAQVDGRLWGAVATGVSPSASNSITWDAADYLEGGTQTFSWTITNSVWDNILPIKVRIYQDDVEYKVFSSCVLGICSDTSTMILYSQTGSMPLRLTGTHRYRADLIETGVFTDTVLSTDSMRVLATAPSQMIVNTSIPSRSPFNVWQSVGYSFGASQIRINVEHKKNGIWQLEGAFAVLSSPGNTQITVYDIGEYRFTLIDITQGVKLVVKEAMAYAVDLPVQVNISTSILTIDKTTYYYRDIMQGFYAIDNNNWTNGNTPYLAIRNTTSGLITAVFKQKIGTDQQNNFMLVIGDGNELPSNKFRPGNNSIELHSFNLTNDRLLNLTYFELLDTDVNGNKLRTDKYRYCKNEQVLILASMPLQGNITIYNYKDLTTALYSQNINGTDVSIIFKTTTEGDYLVSLKDYSGKQVRSADFVVSSSCEPITPTPTPATWSKETTDPGYTASIIDSQVSLLGMGVNNTSRFLFAMVWTIIFLVGGFAITGNNPSGGLYSAMLPIGFFTSLSFIQSGVEFFPRYFVIIIAFIVVIKTGIVK